MVSFHNLPIFSLPSVTLESSAEHAPSFVNASPVPPLSIPGTVERALFLESLLMHGRLLLTQLDRDRQRHRALLRPSLRLIVSSRHNPKDAQSKSHADVGKPRRTCQAVRVPRTRPVVVRLEGSAAAAARSRRLELLAAQTTRCLDAVATKLRVVRSMAADHPPSVENTQKPEEAAVDNDILGKEAAAQEAYVTLAHATSVDVKAQPSALIGTSLTDYQMAGLRWLASLRANNLNGILADEMGLGKTVQTLALFAYAREMSGWVSTDASNPEKSRPSAPIRPFLVVCPLSVMDHWAGEAARRLPSFRVSVVRGNMSERAAALQCQRVDIFIVQYETAIRQWREVAAAAPTGGFEYLVVDEGHRLKNHSCQLAVCLRRISSCHRLLLTGTPLSNHVEELWALLNFVLPDVFDSSMSFADWFRKPPAARTSAGHSGSDDSDEGEVDAVTLTDEERLAIIHRLHAVLRPFLLRRTKVVLDATLPPRTELTFACPLSPLQAFMHDIVARSLMSPSAVGQVASTDVETPSMADDNATAKGAEVPDTLLTSVNGADVVEAVSEDTKSRLATVSRRLGAVANPVMEIRKIVNHPFLCYDDPAFVFASEGADAEDKPLHEDPRWISALLGHSGKFAVFDALICRLLAAGHRVLVFSQFVGTLTLLEDLLDARHIQSVRLDGTTSAADRTVAVTAFDRREADVFLLSTRAGGLGLNLQSADTVVMFDSDWNPQADAQAKARAHRLGQRRHVLVITLASASPVEQRLLAAARAKSAEEARVIGAGGFAGQSVSRGERERTDADLRASLRASNVAATAADDIVSPKDATAIATTISRDALDRSAYTAMVTPSSAHPAATAFQKICSQSSGDKSAPPDYPPSLLPFNPAQRPFDCDLLNLKASSHIVEKESATAALRRWDTSWAAEVAAVHGPG
eukprot:TRINITY_DN731_c1_g1_i1.p1 TRINITY_DN731_c1_g1~~TRINITY_DN731_c1_g1_i1.p1  ORF type:complete len:922 (+),score=82.87 TRINITY_DN731_c1_g1_i1:88-2853(+)